MSISSGGSSPLVNKACKWGIGGETLCLLTTLSKYLWRKQTNRFKTPGLVSKKSSNILNASALTPLYY